MALYQIPTVEQFNFSQPESWIRRFERFCCASGIANESEKSQVNSLIYSMGDKADDIMRSFSLSAEDQKKYEVVKNKFDSFFPTIQHHIQASSIHVSKKKTRQWTNSSRMYIDWLNIADSRHFMTK